MRVNLHRKLVQARWLVAAVVVTAAPGAWAELTLSPTAPVKITPALIRQASTPMSTLPSPSRETPALLGNEAPLNDIFRDTPRNLENIPNGCARNSASLCYDYRTGRAIYKPTRKLLPSIPGMTPHNLAVHRDKIVAQYTFK